MNIKNSGQPNVIHSFLRNLNKDATGLGWLFHSKQHHYGTAATDLLNIGVFIVCKCDGQMGKREFWFGGVFLLGFFFPFIN